VNSFKLPVAYIDNVLYNVTVIKKNKTHKTTEEKENEEDV